MSVITVEIISDFVCVRHLERGIAIYNKTYPGARTDDSIVITHRPYLLNHSTQSVEKHVLREKKLANFTPEQRAAMVRRVEQAGRAAGIVFRDGGRVGPTQDAHRLVHRCRDNQDVQSALIQGVFEAYHEQERDISDREVLRELGLAAGMSDDEIEDAFTSPNIIAEVDAEVQRSKHQVAGTGVPVYLIQGQHRIDGAQDPMEFVETFVKVKEAASSG